jgi:NAD kinase
VSVTMNGGSTIRGGVFALGASITLDSNTIRLAEICPASPSYTSLVVASTSTSASATASNSIINICNCQF